MSVLVLLIFVSLGIALTFLAAFIWAVRTGQYEDTATPSMRLLLDDSPTRRDKTNFQTQSQKKNP